MAESRQSYSTEVAATPEQCFATIMDFPSYPTWSALISSSSVREVDETGRPKIVAFELDMRIKTIRYVLDYRTEPPGFLEWHLVEGDLASVEGCYRFERKGKTKSLVTCEQTVDLGFWIPGPLRRLAEQKALSDSVEEFKAEVERRVREGTVTGQT